MDKRFINLYDEYVHGFIDRRRFIDRLTLLAGSTAAATALLPMIENDMARAETVPESDGRITVETVSVPGVNGLKGYLARPRAGGRRPAVLVIHENRGLNPHIRDVTRRFATEGFLALGLDYLSPLGGTPENQDAATQMFMNLKPEDVLASGRAAVAYLDGHANSNGKVGAVGFCWGGGAVNDLAWAEPRLDAGVPYYGRQPAADKVAQIRAPLLIQYAEHDERINAGMEAYATALRAANKPFEQHVYAGTGHGFNNDTNQARYNKAQADVAWGRTVTWFRRHLV